MHTSLLALLMVTGPLAASETSDCALLNLALSHFASRTDTMSPHEDGNILVNEQAAQWTEDKARFYGLARNRKAKYPIPRDLINALVARNATGESSTTTLPEPPR
jgi:hypothetical protein